MLNRISRKIRSNSQPIIASRMPPTPDTTHRGPSAVQFSCCRSRQRYITYHSHQAFAVVYRVHRPEFHAVYRVRSISRQRAGLGTWLLVSSELAWSVSAPPGVFPDPTSCSGQQWRRGEQNRMRGSTTPTSPILPAKRAPCRSGGRGRGQSPADGELDWTSYTRAKRDRG